MELTIDSIGHEKYKTVVKYIQGLEDLKMRDFAEEAGGHYIRKVRPLVVSDIGSVTTSENGGRGEPVYNQVKVKTGIEINAWVKKDYHSKEDSENQCRTTEAMQGLLGILSKEQ